MMSLHTRNRSLQIVLRCALTTLIACAGVQQAPPQRTSAHREHPARETKSQRMTHDDLLAPAATAALQRALNEHGYSLPVNGHYDNATEGALRAYQQAQKLAATGMPDMATLRELGLEPLQIYGSQRSGEPTRERAR